MMHDPRNYSVTLITAVFDRFHNYYTWEGVGTDRSGVGVVGEGVLGRMRKGGRSSECSRRRAKRATVVKIFRGML